MKLIDQLFGQPDVRRLTMARLNAAASAQAPQRDLHNLLFAYWANNGLYDYLAQNRYEQGLTQEALKGLRNPCASIVDFYVSHLWPGDLEDAFPVETENERIREPIDAIWEWSNWQAEKDVAAAWYAIYGDLFIRVGQPEDRQQVYLELVSPQHVTDFVEERGFLKWLRLDVPTSREGAAGITERRTHTEEWSKAEQVYRRWDHTLGLDAKLEDLGMPAEEISFVEMGIDFVPFVHAPFRNVGEKWGVGAYTTLLEKIDELARKATRHSQIMFNHLGVTWSLERPGVDSSGRPTPPPTIDTDTDGVVTIGEGRFFRIPAGWALKQMVPALDYDAYLKTIESEEISLSRDAPEMLWSRFSETNELSGRALRFLLAPAIKRVERARTNADRAIIRAVMMALHIGQQSGMPSFQNLGTYESGDFDHTYAKRDVLPVDTLEEAQVLKTKAEASLLLKQLGWTDAALQEREFGLTQEEMATMAAQREVEPVEVVVEPSARALLTEGGQA